LCLQLLDFSFQAAVQVRRWTEDWHVRPVFLGLILVATSVAVHEVRAQKPHRWQLASPRNADPALAFDSATLELTNDQPTAWVRIQYRTPQKLSADSQYVEIKALWDFDCAGRATSTRMLVYYGRSGRDVWSRTLHEGSARDWEPVIPESFGEDLLRAVCDFVGQGEGSRGSRRGGWNGSDYQRFLDSLLETGTNR